MRLNMKSALPLTLAFSLMSAAALSGCSKSTAKKPAQRGTAPAPGAATTAADQSQPDMIDPSQLKHDCKTARACLEAGYCTHEKGSCVVKKNEDCEFASVCKRDGKCTATKGQCVVGKTSDCKQSHRCKHKGECAFKSGSCAAASPTDCEQSKRCKHKGECKFQDGECVTGKL